MHGGVYNYSPFVLRLTFLGLFAGHAMPTGIALGALYLAALSALPPPRSRTEFLARAATAISPATLFLLERANFDIIIFLAILLGALLTLRSFILHLPATSCFALPPPSNISPSHCWRCYCANHAPASCCC